MKNSMIQVSVSCASETAALSLRISLALDRVDATWLAATAVTADRIGKLPRNYLARVMAGVDLLLGRD